MTHDPLHNLVGANNENAYLCDVDSGVLLSVLPSLCVGDGVDCQGGLRSRSVRGDYVRRDSPIGLSDKALWDIRVKPRIGRPTVGPLQHSTRSVCSIRPRNQIQPSTFCHRGIRRVCTCEENTTVVFRQVCVRVCNYGMNGDGIVCPVASLCNEGRFDCETNRRRQNGVVDTVRSLDYGGIGWILVELVGYLTVKISVEVAGGKTFGVP